MIYRKPLLSLLFLLILLIAQTSCEKFTGDQSIPAYISIDSIYLTTNYSLEGTASQSITDAWVYVDDELIGAFQLPARFPVLREGNHTITVSAGIKKNGIASTRIAYEYYKPIANVLRITGDSLTKLNILKTTYQTTTNFVWREDFEGTSISLDTTKKSLASLQKTPAGSPLKFEGQYSGMVILDSARSFFECTTFNEYIIPMTPVFLEMNFNTSNELTVGVIVYTNITLYQIPIITLNKTDGAWKKIYIDLSNSLIAYPNVTTYKVYLGTFIEEGVAQTMILLDNFKLVTRK